MIEQAEIKILEAEGELNREIEASLNEFRKKLIENLHSTNKPHNLKEYETSKEGPEKKFHFRESLLSIMFEIKDFRTIYNMVVASFIILTLSLLYDSYTKKGEILDIITLKLFFRGSNIVLITWVSMAISTYFIIPLMKLALITHKIIWLPLYLVQLSTIMWLGMTASKSTELGFASIFIIMAEAIRMILKSHSYFRTKLLYLKPNTYKNYALSGITVMTDSRRRNSIENNDHEDKKQDKNIRIVIENGDFFSEIKKFSYYFVCPTLIYRDSYTLTPVRSNAKMLFHFINFLACVYYSFMLYLTWTKPVIQSLEQKLNVSTIIFAVINLMMPSMFFLVLGFFGFLHSWLNLWSQITRFPDRAFYSDWWNSCEFGSYYRKWNITVHDWLYYYVYLDLCRFFPYFQKKKAIPQLLTFVISAIIHELILYEAMGFFYPMLFILFAGPGIIFVQTSMRKISVNLIFWLEMYIGTSMMFTFYLIQCFARNKISDDFIYDRWGSLSSLIPRTIYLGGQQANP